MYDFADSSLRQGGLPELARLTEALEGKEPSLEEWDFEPVDQILDILGRDRFVLGMADVELGSTMDWAETFLIGLIKAPDLVHRFLDAHLKRTLLPPRRSWHAAWTGCGVVSIGHPIMAPCFRRAISASSHSRASDRSPTCAITMACHTSNTLMATSTACWMIWSPLA